MDAHIGAITVTLPRPLWRTLAGLSVSVTTTNTTTCLSFDKASQRYFTYMNPAYACPARCIENIMFLFVCVGSSVFDTNLSRRVRAGDVQPRVRAPRRGQASRPGVALGMRGCVAEAPFHPAQVPGAGGAGARGVHRFATLFALGVAEAGVQLWQRGCCIGGWGKGEVGVGWEGW